MAKNVLSMKELNKTDQEPVVEKERFPKYFVKPPCFTCPLSPYIMWHHNFRYVTCPVTRNNRDMVTCEKCSLRGDGKMLEKRNNKDRTTNEKQPQKVEKRDKETIPTIGKTYNSDKDG
jgi:hypothetical protein